MMEVITKDYSKSILGEKMIKTIKVTVAGEQTSFYIEPKHLGVLLKVLDQLDVIYTPASLKLPLIPVKPEPNKLKWLTREEGGCVKCGRFRGKRRAKKMFCLACQRERRAKRI